MIKSIRLQNFQAHRDSKISFSPGVNAIIGKTGAGKTSILRALRWVIFNKPAGDALQAHWGGDVRVEIELDDGTTITRVRTKTQNLYIMDGKEFGAIGQGVPAEIKAALNIEDLNFRSQMDAPFLLSQSPGEVAQVLNKIVNLDVIDVAQSNIRKKKASIDAELKVKKQDIEKLEAQVTEFSYLDDMETGVAELETMEKALAALLRSMAAIQSILEENGRQVAKKAQTAQVLRMEKSYQKVADLVRERRRVVSDIEKIGGILGAINAQTTKQKQVDAFLSAEKHLNTVLLLVGKKKQKDDDYEKIGRALISIQADNERIEMKTRALAILEERFHKLMPKQCPLCGQEVP